MAKKEQTKIYLVDRVIGDNPSIRILAEVMSFPSTYEAYFSRLCLERGLPANGANEIVEYTDQIRTALRKIQENPEVKRISDDKRREKLIMETLTLFVTENVNKTRQEAILLALTVPNDFENEPEPYEYPEVLNLPGIIPTPILERDLTQPLERRYKQLLDSLTKIENSVQELEDAMRQLSINANNPTQFVTTDKRTGL